MNLNLRNSFVKKDSSKCLYKRIFDDILKQEKLKSGPREWIWYAFVLLGYGASYGLVFQTTSAPGAAFFGALSGFFAATSGLTCGHEIIHKASFRSKFLNILGAYIYSDIIAGVSSANWKRSHNIFHHNNTNIKKDGQWVDPDLISVYGLRRIFKGRRRLFMAAMPILFLLSMLRWNLYADFRILLTGRHDKNPDLRYTYSTSDYTMTLICKLFFIGSLLFPLFVLSFGQFLAFFLLNYFTKGLYLGTSFLIAHTQHDVLHVTDYEDVKQRYSWEEIQVLTSANFCMSNAILTRLVGGLNYQIEHHLFPYVNPRLYPRISEEIRVFAAKNNLPYIEYRTMAASLNAVIGFFTVDPPHNANSAPDTIRKSAGL